MVVKEKKVSQIGFKLSEIAYKNTKKMYYFTMFFLPGIENLTLNDFILLITIIYVSLEGLEKFAVLKYPYSKNLFTAVRVPEEIRTQIENLRKKENENKNDNKKINLSEIIPSILERLNDKDTWISLFAILYLISFINDTFGEFISKEEKENFTKRLILPDFIKKNVDTIFEFFSEDFFEYYCKGNSNEKQDSYKKFKQATERIVEACNTSYKEVYGDSLKEYHSENMLYKFEEIWSDVTAIYIIIKEITPIHNVSEINPGRFASYLNYIEDMLYHISFSSDPEKEIESWLSKGIKDEFRYHLFEAPKLFARKWEYFYRFSLRFLIQL